MTLCQCDNPAKYNPYIKETHCIKCGGWIVVKSKEQSCILPEREHFHSPLNQAIEELRDLIFKTDKDMQMDDAATLYPLVIKRLNHIIKKLKGELNEL